MHPGRNTYIYKIMYMQCINMYIQICIYIGNYMWYKLILQRYFLSKRYVTSRLTIKTAKLLHCQHHRLARIKHCVSLEHVLTVQPQELLRFPTRVMKSGRLTVVEREKWMAKTNRPKLSRHIRYIYCYSWWLNQPIWKIQTSKWLHPPEFWGWKFKKYWKPAPRNSLM